MNTLEILMSEINHSKKIEDRHILQFNSVKSDLPEEVTQQLINKLFSALRQQYDSRIQTVAWTSATAGIVGCEFNDMLEAADQVMLWSINYFKPKAQFNTFFYNNFKNEIRTRYSQFGASSEMRYRALGYNYEQVTTPELQRAVRRASKNIKQLDGFILSSWVESEEEVQRFIEENRTSVIEFITLTQARNRKRIPVQRINSLESLTSGASQGDSEEDSPTLLEKIAGVDDSHQLQRIELLDAISRYVEDRRVRTLLFFMLKGYGLDSSNRGRSQKYESNLDKAYLCRKFKCSQQQLKGMLSKAAKALSVVYSEYSSSN